MLEEPYHSLSLLVNTDTSEYIFRVLGTTRERGFYLGMEDLKDIIRSKFDNTVACVGNPRLKIEEGAVQVKSMFLKSLTRHMSIIKIIGSTL